MATHHVARQVDIRRAYSSMAYLAAFIGANLASWQNYPQATLWYRTALSHAAQAGDREATGWIAARSTLIPVHRGDHRQAMHDAAYAVAISVRGQLGSTLGNALAASTAARLGHRDIALMALRDAERATEGLSPHRDDLDVDAGRAVDSTTRSLGSEVRMGPHPTA